MLDLDPIKARLPEQIDDFGTYSHNVGAYMQMEYVTQVETWERSRNETRAKINSDIAALIEEVERVRAENASLFEAAKDVLKMNEALLEYAKSRSEGREANENFWNSYSQLIEKFGSQISLLGRE